MEITNMDSMIFPTFTEADTQLPFYFVGIGQWNNQEAIHRPSGYPEFQWLHCTSGEGELIIEGRIRTIKPNQGIFMFPDIPHDYYAVREPWGVSWIAFNGHQVQSLVRIAGIEKSGLYSITHNEIILTHLQSILAIAESERSMTGLDYSKLTYNLLIDLIKHVADSTTSIEQNALKLQPVLDYIENHYDKTITLEQLANTLGVTPQHLCLLFKKTLQIRPMEYINRTRINKSKKMMFNEINLNMYEISRRVGFDSPSYFSSLFKKVEGITPESFKKLHGML
jgi:AraC family transcriptional regulator of arabinose operon